MILGSANMVFQLAEDRGWLVASPPVITDYALDYPELLELEQNYPTVRERS